MRVLHLSDRASSRGGADLYLLGLLSHMHARCEVLLAVGSCELGVSLPCRVEQVPALAAPARAAVHSELEALVAEFRPHVIHVHNVMNPEALEWAASRGAVATIHDHRCFCPGRGKLTMAGKVCQQPMSRTLCADCFDDADYAREIYERTQQRLRALGDLRRITVLSRYMRAELVAVGLDARRVSVVPPFVHSLDPSARPSGPPCVLFAGRLVRAKGVDDAVLAWRRAELDLPLVFAGTGPERARLEADGLTVLGWQPLPEMAGIYRRAAALLMPSRWQEPFGIVGLEALQMGAPVVAWDSGAVREWLPSAVDWGDVDALASALRAAVGTKGAPPPGFDRQQAIARMMDLYRDLAA